MLLEAYERERFVAWLQQEIESNQLLGQQIEKLCLPATACTALAEKYRIEGQACEIVKRILTTGEQVTIAAGP